MQTTLCIFYCLNWEHNIYRVQMILRLQSDSYFSLFSQLLLFCVLYTFCRSEKFFRRLFREVFSTIRLCTDVFIMFLLECAHCFAFHFLRKLCCGLLFIILSALSAPGLTDCYNVVFWPLAVCSSQICQAMRIVATPCIECFGGIVGRCVEVVSAFRPVHVVSYKSHEPHHTQPSHHHRVPSPHDSV